jgi:hypothetical protein
MIGAVLDETMRSVAWLIGALAMLLGVFQVGRRVRHLALDVKGVKVDMDTVVKPGVTETVASVNNKAPDETPLFGQVKQIRASLDEHVRYQRHWNEHVIKQLGIEPPPPLKETA